MKKVIPSFAFILLLFSGCNQAPQKQFQIVELTNGFNQYEAFKIDKADSIKYLKLPPPAFDGNLANINIYEDKQGRVYAYILPYKEPLCGFPTEGHNRFNIYDRSIQKDTILKNRIQLTANNADSFINATLALAKGHFPMYSFGIHSNDSKNKLLLRMVNILYHHPHLNIWKVRPVIAEEKAS